MVQWYYGKTGSPEGPIDESGLRERIVSGAIGEETLVWKRGMAEWQKLSSLPEWESLGHGAPARERNDDTPPALPEPVVEKKSHIPPPRAKSQNPYVSTASVRRIQHTSSPYYGQTAATTSGAAVASLVCGILGLTLCGLFTMIPAILCGHKALAEIRVSGGRMKGQGMAQVGLALGYLGLGLMVLGLLLVIGSGALH